MKLAIKILITYSAILSFTSCKTNRSLIEPTLTYSSAEILKMAEWRFDYNLDVLKLCDLYVLDGVPYEQKEIDSALMKYDKRDIRMINFLKKSNENTWWDRNCELIPQIQTTLIEQKREYKKEVVNRIIDIYKRYEKEMKEKGTVCSYCPLIIINNKPITNESEVLSKLIKLKMSKINFVADYETPHKIFGFGQFSKNVVVEIFIE